MEQTTKQAVRQILTNFLDEGNRRKTPERFAILDAVYDMAGHFTLEELGETLEKQNFRVSRATLYNTMSLFLKLRLVVRHALQDGTKYEAAYRNENHCHQICTVCGKVVEVKSPLITEAVNETKLHRFHRDGFSLYIYGVCSSCQSKLTRRKSYEESHLTARLKDCSAGRKREWNKEK